MASENRSIASTHIRHSSSRGYFVQEAIRSGYVGPELGRTQLVHFRDYDNRQHFPLYPHSHPFPSPHPHHIQEAIQIEMEQIRKERIMLEILRRRALEAEVRRELMIERELALRRDINGPILGSALTIEFDSLVRLPHLGARAQEWSLEERAAPSLTEWERPIARHETGGYEVMAPGGTSDLRISEVNPVSEVGKEREEIILPAKPDGNISGSKRKVEIPPPQLDAIESPSDDPLRKKAKSDWACAVCQVSATSERGLNEHLRGKKHKSKEEAMKAQVSGKNYCIGFCPKKPTKPVRALGAANPHSEKAGTQKLQESKNMKNLKKNGKAMIKKVKKNNVTEKEKFRFWCEMCQVGTFSQEVLNAHRKGKKHKTREQSKQNGGAAPSYWHGKNVMIHMKRKRGAQDGKNVA